LTTIVQRVKPTSRAVPSYDWLTVGLKHLLSSIVFYHKNFSLSTHESSHITTTIHKLFQDGRLTKEPARVKCWVGVYILRKLTVAMLVDGLENGAMNWDVTLSKVTSIILQSALSSRSGDLATDPLDDQPLPFLCYEDITLKLVGGDRLENLVAKFVIRNEKGAK
jgi:hypothetical protein